MNFNWDLILRDEWVGVWCKTKCQAKNLLLEAHNKGLEWSTGDSFADDNRWHEQGTVYFLKTGHFSFITPPDYRKRTILTFEQAVVGYEFKFDKIKLYGHDTGILCNTKLKAEILLSFLHKNNSFFNLTIGTWDRHKDKTIYFCAYNGCGGEVDNEEVFTFEEALIFEEENEIKQNEKRKIKVKFLGI